MGLLRGNLRLLLEEHRRRPLCGSLLQLGRTSLFFDRDELLRWMRWHSVRPAREPAPTLSHDPRLAAQGCMGDRALFEALGFDEVVSSDISDREGCEVLFNLNESLPPDLEGRFDVVFDGGTLHHVFDVPRALGNLHRALKPGGRLVLASVPVNNHVDHGFYMFSPTLFSDYFEANRYEIDTCLVCRARYYWVDGLAVSTPWRVTPYRPGCLDHLSYGGFGSEQTTLFLVVTRTDESTCDVKPVQSYFARYLQAHPRTTGGESGSLRTAPRRGRLYRLAKRLYTRWRHWRDVRRLTVAGDY
jgi:SAM-dependent methyltransferase